MHNFYSSPQLYELIQKNLCHVLTWPWHESVEKMPSNRGRFFIALGCEAVFPEDMALDEEQVCANHLPVHHLAVVL